jgi:DNA-binding transcriptional ArsR family regulator
MDMTQITNERDVVDVRVIKALGHPLRTRALTILNERVASPNELAQMLDAPLGSVAYHVRILLDLGAIELVRTEPRRGAVEHFYRATMRPFFSDADWAAMPEPLRKSISSATLGLIWKDVRAATEAGTFDERDDRHLSRTPLVVDEKGWRDVGELLAQVLERAFEIQAESAGRMAESGEEGFSTRLELLHFLAGPPDEETKGASAPKRGRAKRRK